jgi:hypothetical protein
MGCQQYHHRLADSNSPFSESAFSKSRHCCHKLEFEFFCELSNDTGTQIHLTARVRSAHRLLRVAR